MPRECFAEEGSQCLTNPILGWVLVTDHPQSTTSLFVQPRKEKGYIDRANNKLFYITCTARFPMPRVPSDGHPTLDRKHALFCLVSSVSTGTTKECTSRRALLAAYLFRKWRNTWKYEALHRAAEAFGQKFIGQNGTHMHCADDNPLVVQAERLSQTVLRRQSCSSGAMSVISQSFVPRNPQNLADKYQQSPEE